MRHRRRHETPILDRTTTGYVTSRPSEDDFVNQREDVSSKAAKDDVAGRLLATSSSFARSAITAYLAGSWDVYYLHLATAVEHLVKGALATVHPSFIADPKADFDSLLHLSGMGNRAHAPDFVRAVRTIGVDEAMRRIARITDGYQEPGTYVSLLLQARNGIVHAGYGVRQEDEAVLGDVARYFAPILASVEKDAAEFWGDGYGLVEQHAQRRLNLLEAAYERALRAARDRFALRVRDMTQQAIGAFLAAVEPTGPTANFAAFPATCPACEHTGLLTGESEPDWAPDWDDADGQNYVAGMYVESITLRASRFECPACNLTLVDEELALADLDTQTFSSQAFDSQLAYVYFRRLEAEAWYDDYR
jgi:hypothetical protein